jgi:AraC-like DNA-binding protein
MRLTEQIDYSTPRTILENQEEESSSSHSIEEYVSALSRILAWQIEGKKTHLIGLRTMVICHAINPEIIEGMTLDDIAKAFGYGRSAVHKISNDFTTTFNVYGIHQRSKETKKKLSQAWHKKHDNGNSTARPNCPA